MRVRLAVTLGAVAAWTASATTRVQLNADRGTLTTDSVDSILTLQSPAADSKPFGTIQHASNGVFFFRFNNAISFTPKPGRYFNNLDGTNSKADSDNPFVVGSASLSSSSCPMGITVTVTDSTTDAITSSGKLVAWQSSTAFSAVNCSNFTVTSSTPFYQSGVGSSQFIGGAGTYYQCVKAGDRDASLSDPVVQVQSGYAKLTLVKDAMNNCTLSMTQF